MADVVAELATLTERVTAAIEAAGLSPFRDDRAGRRLFEAVIDLLDRYPLDQLEELAADGRLARVIAQAVADTFNGVSAELVADVAARTQEAVRASAEFYLARGIDPIPVSEAVRRTQTAARVGEAFQTGLSQIGTELYEATRDVALDAVAQGSISRSGIEAEIITRTGVAGVKARTQAGIAVGAYNEAWTEELGRQAGLSHVQYAGTLKANSRHFCRAHLGRVFTTGQIDLMDNGQLAPVRIFVGGYRCRHHFNPVDPDWSPELRARLVPEDTVPTRVQLDRAGRSFITVVIPADEVPRLDRQIFLGRSRPDGEPVYSVFENADNATGFVGLHADWLSTRLNADDATRAVLDAEREEARREAETGREALLRAAGVLDIRDPAPRTRAGS